MACIFPYKHSKRTRGVAGDRGKIYRRRTPPLLKQRHQAVVLCGSRKQSDEVVARRVGP